MFLFSGWWEYDEENIIENAKEKRNSVIESIMQDLIPLQKCIVIMERCVKQNCMPYDDIMKVESQLQKSRVEESRAINYLAKLDKLILPVPTHNDERKNK